MRAELVRIHELQEFLLSIVRRAFLFFFLFFFLVFRGRERGREQRQQHNLSPRRRMKAFTDLGTPYSRMLWPRMIIEDYLQFNLLESSAGLPSQEPQTVLGPNKRYTAICKVV